jgi:hypothetical protein
MVNLFPALRGQITRSDVKEYLDQLRALETTGETDGTTLNQVMHWLSDHRFYLSAEQCAEVNRLNTAVAKNLSSEAWRIQYDSFAPNDDMNDSYFIPE